MNRDSNRYQLQKYSNKTQGVTTSVYQKGFVYEKNCSPSEAENQTYSPFSIFPESPLLSRAVNGSSVFNLKTNFIACNFRNFGGSVSEL